MSNSMPLLLTKRDLSERRKLINRNYESINNPKFSEMKDLLENYHIEVEKGIRENIKIENENFKKHFFSSLENLLIQASMIKNEKTKSERIEDIYIWFNKRTQFFKDLNSINARTSKSIYEKYPDIDMTKKSNYYEAGEYPLFFESKHRTQDDGLLPPKDRLKEFKRKTLLDATNNNMNDAMNKTAYNITNVPFASYNNNTSNKDLNSSAFKNNSQNQSQITKKKEQEQDIMNLRVSSATSSNCFRSTHYTMNSSGTKFFNSPNLNNKNSTLNNFNNLNANLSSSLNFTSVNNFNNLNNNMEQSATNFHPTREIKSSYSTFRPRYDYSNLVIEKNNLAAKQKDLAEKRNQEEMKEMLNEWGISKARYVEEVEKKHETQTLLKFYEKNLSNLNSIKNLNSDLGTINSNANKNLSNFSSPKKEPIYNKNSFDSPAKDYNNNNINNNNENEMQNQIFLQSPEKTKNKNIIDINQKQIFKNEISLMRLDSNEKSKSEANVDAKKESNIIRKNSSKAKNLIRTRATKIKNLDLTTNKLTCDKDEKRIEIRFKEDASSEKAKKIIKQMKSTLEKIPTDRVILMKAHDKVFEARHNHATLLNVKEIDNYKDGYKYHVTPLSLYDNLNLENFKDNKFNAAVPEENKAAAVAETKRPSTGFEFLRSRYNKNPDAENFLNQRKTLTNFNKENAYKSSEKVRNMSYNLERVKSAFSPPADEKIYPKYFLPTPGFGLVIRVLDPNAKKKKKRGKSSKKKK